MCHKYHIVHSACWHSHERLRICEVGLTCEDMVDAIIIVHHFCDICTSDAESYKFQNGPSFSADELSNLKELKAQVKRATSVTRRIGMQMPVGCAQPFQGRITRSVLECLKQIEKL